MGEKERGGCGEPEKRGESVVARTGMNGPATLILIGLFDWPNGGARHANKKEEKKTQGANEGMQNQLLRMTFWCTNFRDALINPPFTYPFINTKEGERERKEESSDPWRLIRVGGGVRAMKWKNEIENDIMSWLFITIQNASHDLRNFYFKTLR